jgi:hypothetical protein
VSNQPLTEMSTRNLPGGNGRPAREAKNLTAICEPTGSFDVSQIYGPPQPVTGMDLPFLYSVMALCSDLDTMWLGALIA